MGTRKNSSLCCGGHSALDPQTAPAQSRLMRTDEKQFSRNRAAPKNKSLLVMNLWLATTALCVGAQMTGNLAYLSGSGQENQAVYVMDLATQAAIKVGPGSRDGAPRWSPDGVWLAFETQSDQQSGIYLVRVDGTEGHVVSKGYPSARMPRWSPDGTRLVYEATIEATERPVAVVLDIASGIETVWGGERSFLLRPVWLAGPSLMAALQGGAEFKWEGVNSDLLWQELKDGGLLAIGWTGTPAARSTEVFIVTKTQAAPLLARVKKERVRYGEWAAESHPQGKALAFESNDGGNREIFLLSKRGISDLTNHPAPDWNPVWSPDGDWLAFESFRDGRRGLHRCFVGTARTFAVDTSAVYDCWSPTWSPTGDYLAYVTTETGTLGLKVAAVTGETKQMLSTGKTPAWAPAWAPSVAAKKKPPEQPTHTEASK
jgi:hypothetical protein